MKLKPNTYYKENWINREYFIIYVNNNVVETVAKKGSNGYYIKLHTNRSDFNNICFDKSSFNINNYIDVFKDQIISLEEMSEVEFIVEVLL